MPTSKQGIIFPPDEELLGEYTNNRPNNEEDAEIIQDKELRNKRVKQKSKI